MGQWTLLNRLDILLNVVHFSRSENNSIFGTELRVVADPSQGGRDVGDVARLKNTFKDVNSVMKLLLVILRLEGSGSRIIPTKASALKIT